LISANLALRCIYAACLLGATCNHLDILARHGVFWTYGGQPWLSAAFWTALTVLDPLAAVLLFLRPNAGVLATLAIMLADVPHNLWSIARETAPFWRGIASHPAVLEQIAFLLFVLATARFACKTLPGAGNAANTASAAQKPHPF
jgi:hypothetical protein